MVKQKVWLLCYPVIWMSSFINTFNREMSLHRTQFLETIEFLLLKIEIPSSILCLHVNPEVFLEEIETMRRLCTGLLKGLDPRALSKFYSALL
jgi:hypothetical protein